MMMEQCVRERQMCKNVSHIRVLVEKKQTLRRKQLTGGVGAPSLTSLKPTKNSPQSESPQGDFRQYSLSFPVSFFRSVPYIMNTINLCGAVCVGSRLGESVGAHCVGQRLIDVPVVSALRQIPFNQPHSGEMIRWRSGGETDRGTENSGRMRYEVGCKKRSVGKMGGTKRQKDREGGGDDGG